MNSRIASKSLVNSVIALSILVTSHAAAEVDNTYPALRHRIPGAVTYDSTSSLPEELRQAIANNAVPGDIYAEPLLEQDVRRFINYREIARDSSSTVGKLKIRLVAIKGSVLERYQYMGLIPEGPVRAGPWTSLTRVFLRPDGTPVFLHEWDFPADGGSVTVFKELMNEKIGEAPARLVVKRSSDGRAVSELTWTTPFRQMALSAWGDVLDSSVSNVYNKNWFKGIAESLTEP